MSSWILAGLGSLGSSLIGRVKDQISDYLIGRVLEEPGVADLDKLRNTLSGTERIIGRVENMWIKDEGTKKRLKELLMKLKDTVYDSDDLLDEIQFRVLKQQIEQQGAQGYEASNQSSSSSDLPSSKKRKISERVSRFFGREDDVIRVRKIQTNLDKYTTDIEHFIGKLDADEKQMITSVVPRTTTSFPIETQVFGRDEQLNHLLEQLMKSADGSGSSNSSISTLTIVGIGGVGKTTLAQQAYNHERVKDYFHHKVWVCVSDNFNVERLTKEIIESLTRNKCDLNNFDTLQVVVKEELTSKRFLLVLDDVWNEDSLKWERFCAPLRYGVPGSKILVTTRSEKIAEMVGNRIHLGGLDEASYWKLFKKCAFGSEDAGEFPQLEAIAKKIVGRLKGLPLAARTVGGLLKAEMNEEAWRIIAGNEIWQLPQNEEGVLPVLQLSYLCLPTHLKRCFVFCSLFPKDHRFYVGDDLVRLWMAEGYVAQDNNMTMEDTGSRYFLDLVNRSFFQEAPWGSTYVMHDLIHDLAQFILEGEFCRIDDDESKEIPNTTRHLSATLTDGTKLMELSCYDKLRTLMINSKNFWFGFRVESPLFIQFEKLKNIRVLKLHGCGLRELPETIGELIHLRYLDISYNCQICRLSESLCGLYNLRVLNLQGCELQSFPHGMSKLINLMHLNAADEIISKINNVGKLTSLQGLSSFKVLKDQGHEVAQLGSLKQLHGQLRITNLENVESKQEASKANLNNKEYLDELVLEWTSDDGSSLDGNELVVSEEVLEGLQPHQALKRLTIRGYNGVRSPSWLQAQLLANLRTLRLINCKAWKDLSCIGQLPNLKNLYVEGMPAVKQISHELSTESKFLPNLEELVLEKIVALEELPSLGQLPCLKVLRIEKMPAVKKLGDGFFGSRDQGKCFPSLEELKFWDMPEWEEWTWADDRQLFPCLRNLEIRSCPRLKRMPPLPTSVESLSLYEVGLTEVPRLWEEIDGSSSSMIVSELKIYSLEEIKLVDIPECEELPCLGQLPGLKVLHIEGMPAVKKVGDGFFGSRDESKCFPSLEELKFWDMPEWEEWTWADDRQLFPCLRNLEIGSCPRLKRMPPLPTSVESLSLYEVGLTEVPRLWEEIDGSSSSMIVSELKIYSLEEIKLVDIPECEELPCLGQLPGLKVLHIEGMPAVKKVGDGFFGSRDESKCFPSLEELTFRDMPQWEEWSWADGRQLFPCLRKLQIERCPRLKRMPPLPPPVETLEIDEVGLTELPGLWEGIHGGGSCITASLSTLTIRKCPNLRNLEEGLLSHSLPNISDIEIAECAELVWLPVKEFKELTSLAKLSIRSCPKLLSMTRDGDNDILLPPSIKELVLSDCGNLGKLLLGCLHNLTSLTRLEIGDCRCIESLPATSLLHLKRLQYLKFWKCGELRSKDELLLNEGNEQVEGSSVTELCIDDTALFKLSFLRRTLPSVRALTISNFHRATMSDEEEQLLRSLTALRVLEFEDCKNLQSLPTELHALPSLRLLSIIGCPEIQALPEKGLPMSLKNLHFRGCQARLTEQLQKHLAEIKSSGRFLVVDELAIRKDRWSSLGYGFNKLARWKLRQTALNF
ncbi:unnamed protein product [Musa hybrid cultivar]